MNRAEMVQEVVDRGFNYVSTARIGRFIDTAYRNLCARHPWPFLETTKEGTPPLEIADLRKILSVTDTTHDEKLRGVDRRWLVSAYPDLPDTGSPSFWYLENKTLKTYPAEAVELSIRYIKLPAKMSESSEPLVPEEWQEILINRAVVRCLRDDDELEQARALEGDVEVEIREMVHAELGRNLQGPSSVVRTGRPVDYA